LSIAAAHFNPSVTTLVVLVNLSSRTDRSPAAGGIRMHRYCLAILVIAASAEVCLAQARQLTFRVVGYEDHLVVDDTEPAETVFREMTITVVPGKRFSATQKNDAGLTFTVSGTLEQPANGPEMLKFRCECQKAPDDFVPGENGQPQRIRNVTVAESRIGITAGAEITIGGMQTESRRQLPDGAEEVRRSKVTYLLLIGSPPQEL
jgi:hypothetical protein